MLPGPRRSILAALALVSALGAAGTASARTAEDVIAAVRAATARYLDIAQARADGYVQISGMEERHGYHFLNVNAQVMAAAAGLWSGALDLARPPILLYVERDGTWQLVGVEYALPAAPAESPFPGARWHRHEASCHYRDYRETPAPSASACPPRHPESGAEFALWHPALAVVHVWAWHPNPLGPFAEENPYLAPYGGRPHTAAHHRVRSGAELAYSEWSHRVSGVFLLLIAAVVFWESRRERGFPWSALSAPLWVAFGAYLFVRGADPEAWPSGPKAFAEIFTDLEVLQHKLLSLLPVAIGIVEWLRAAGRLRRPAWAYLFPTLAVIGGAALMVHVHEGSFHLDSTYLLDATYLQHAAMGVAALGLGLTLLVTRRRRERASRLLARAWPACLALVAVALILYSER